MENEHEYLVDHQRAQRYAKQDDALRFNEISLADFYDQHRRKNLYEHPVHVILWDKKRIHEDAYFYNYVKYFTVIKMANYGNKITFYMADGNNRTIKYNDMEKEMILFRKAPRLLGLPVEHHAYNTIPIVV